MKLRLGFSVLSFILTESKTFHLKVAWKRYRNHGTIGRGKFLNSQKIFPQERKFQPIERMLPVPKACASILKDIGNKTLV
jgi:hypothetical protein